MSECPVLTSASDDPDIYHGGPVGVQLVARKFEEEKIWAIVKIVVAALEKMKAETAVHWVLGLPLYWDKGSFQC